MNVLIAPLTIETYEGVFALWQQCEGVGLSESDSKENIRTYLLRNPDMSFIATVDDSLAGGILCGHDGRRGYIYHLAVRPQYRRQGIARRLVNSCLHSLRRIGIQKCHIFIFNENQDGIAFWKSLGWTPRHDISVISKNIEPFNALEATLPRRSL